MSIGFMGFGEAARAIVRGWDGRWGPILAYDIKLDDEALAPGLHAACQALSVTPASPSHLADCPLILSLVTADQALVAARSLAGLADGRLWVDGNSCSPGQKQQAALCLGSGYVDMAIMAPIHPRLHQTPVLLSGPRAQDAAERLTRHEMRVTVVGDRVGQASGIKMLRSVIVKGIEALTAESFLAARRAGVEGDVIASLQASDPGFDWLARGGYNLERMMHHGRRRAAEMREVAATLRELGLPDDMAQATTLWQERIGTLDLTPDSTDFAGRVDQVLARL